MNEIPFGPTPQPTDLVISRKAGYPRKYTLGTVQFPVQMICANRQSAVNLCTEFAAIQGLRVWHFANAEKPHLIFESAVIVAS